MSMGHTVAVKAIEGCGRALSMTIPVGHGNTSTHEVYVEIPCLPGYDFEKVAASIKADPLFCFRRNPCNEG